MTAKGAKIVLTESYDLFSKIDIEHSMKAEVEPLVSFDLSTKTLIKFDSILDVVRASMKINQPIEVNQILPVVTNDKIEALTILLIACEGGEIDKVTTILNNDPGTNICLNF